MANVLLKNITKKYDKIVAVNSIDLKITDQEFVVLVGPSGCGKTTTLRMIAGLEDITEGEIYIGDKLVNDLPPKDRNIAMVFQSYALYPHMKIFDNLAFGLKMRKLPKAERKVKVEKAAEILGIQDFLDRKPKQLSGGQRQRVALGRAIVRDPEIFLFDEPLSNLDAKLRVQMRTELKKLHERLNATVVYVTHDQVEAMTMGDRIVVMKDGIIQQVGAPLELYDQPNNIFVAGFIGSPAMNFIPCRILEENSRLYVSTDGIKISLPDSIAAKVRSHSEREFIFGFRPEDLYAKESGLNRSFQTETIRAEINVIEILGKESYLDLSAGKNSFAALIISDKDNKPHQSIDLEVNLEKIHLFSKQSDEAIV